MNSRRQDINLRPSYLNQLTELEGRLFKDESMKSTKWDDLRGNIEEQIVKNTYLNAQMTAYADYSNIPLEKNRRLFWIDENGHAKNVVETVGIAASTKDSLSFMISSIRPVNRLVSQSMNAKGPYTPPVFTQPLKLRSVLKGAKEKFQIINAIQVEKGKEKRPLSCGGVRQRPGTGSSANRADRNGVDNNFNSAINGFKSLRISKNNFTDNDKYEQEINIKDE